MTTLAPTGTVVAHTIPAQTQKRTMLVSLATVAMIIGVASGFAYFQADRAMNMLHFFLPDNRFSGDDTEILRILSAAFAPSVVGLLLAFFGAGLQDDCKQ
jgi:hypothetical protein